MKYSGEMPGDSSADFLNPIRWMVSSSWLFIFRMTNQPGLKKLIYREADLHFVNLTDTFETRSLNMLAREVYWNNDPENNLLESLDARHSAEHGKAGDRLF